MDSIIAIFRSANVFIYTPKIIVIINGIKKLEYIYFFSLFFCLLALIPNALYNSSIPIRY